jgi:hypothetical protein
MGSSTTRLYDLLVWSFSLVAAIMFWVILAISLVVG